MSTPIKILVVGWGQMGKSHAKAYHAMDGFEIDGVVSRGEASQRDLLEADYPRFSNYEEALAATNPDAVSINTYPDAASLRGQHFTLTNQQGYLTERTLLTRGDSFPSPRTAFSAGQPPRAALLRGRGAPGVIGQVEELHRAVLIVSGTAGRFIISSSIGSVGTFQFTRRRSAKCAEYPN